MMEKAGEEDKPLCSSTDFTDAVAGQAGSGSEPIKGMEDPPVGWFEPLEEDWEEDDAQSWDLDGVRDAEMESLAGESERSGSVAGSERNYRGRGVASMGYEHVAFRLTCCLIQKDTTCVFFLTF